MVAQRRGVGARLGRVEDAGPEPGEGRLFGPDERGVEGADAFAARGRAGRGHQLPGAVAVGVDEVEAPGVAAEPLGRRARRAPESNALEHDELLQAGDPLPHRGHGDVLLRAIDEGAHDEAVGAGCRAVPEATVELPQRR